MRHAVLALALLCGAGTAHAQSTYIYSARIGAMPPQGAVAAGAQAWRCMGTACTASTSWTAPTVARCIDLARVAGPVQSFGRKGAMLSAADLAACNRSRVSSIGPSPGERIVGTVARSGIRISTGELSAVGGAMAASAPPIRVATPELSAVGGGMAATGATIRITTPELSAIGK